VLPLDGLIEPELCEEALFALRQVVVGHIPSIERECVTRVTLRPQAARVLADTPITGEFASR
jgi:hypothetical protein